MRKILSSVILLAVLVSLVSCHKDDPKQFCSATVTAKKVKVDKYEYMFQVDDHTAILVQGNYPFKTREEQRALINFYVREKDKHSVTSFPYPGIRDVWYVELASVDTIYTKPTVASQGKEKDAEVYGDEPMGLVIDPSYFPTTLVEDGYLNLCFSFDVSNPYAYHTINLVTGSDPENPYLVEVRHKVNESNGGGIPIFTNPFIFNFPLSSLPDTKGETVTLTLKWKSAVSGRYETRTFPYKSRSDWNNAN